LIDVVFLDHFEMLENNQEANYEKENHQIAGLFQEWFQALDVDDEQKTKDLESAIDQFVDNHPFPYFEAKEWYKYSISKECKQKACYATALSNYRDCKQEPWTRNDDFGVIRNRVSNDAKIGVIGYLGTGTEDATYLLKKMMQKAPDIEVILHLGDIYECGTPFECIENFMNPINRVFEELEIPKVPIFTIPGNHEYYSGAKGYFQLIDVLNCELDSGWEQEASYFCLRSEDGRWQFLGADTGLNCINHQREPGLQASEADWHIARLRESGGKSVLLTHHQLVSAVDPLNSSEDGDLSYYNKRLLQQFEEDLDQIDLWLWGHDQKFIPYVEDLHIPTHDGSCPILKRGQLLGGSAREKSATRSLAYTDVVQGDKEGCPIDPCGSSNGSVSHTYGIIDLKDSQISYYEVGAWDDGETPSYFAPEEPIFVCEI